MNQRDVEHIIKERHSPEDSDPARNTATQSFEQRDQRDDGPQSHQQKTKRRRILRSIQERQQRWHRRSAISSRRTSMPRTWIAIQIKPPQHKKERHRRKSNP